MVHLSHPYMTIGKSIALTRQTFVSKITFLPFNMLSRFVIAFFSKEQVSFNFMPAVTICSDFGAQENKVCHCFHCFPIYLTWILITCWIVLGGTSGKESACQCKRLRRWSSGSWVRKIPWRRKWQPIPVFLPGESHGQRSLTGYSPWGRKESDTTEHPHTLLLLLLLSSLVVWPWADEWGNHVRFLHH